MNATARLLRWVTTMLLVAAMPALAADKLFTVSATAYDSSYASLGPAIPAGQVSVLLVDFYNRTPTAANSVIKSVQVAVPADIKYAILSSKTVNNGTCAAPSGTFPTDATETATITLNNIVGVKPAGHFCLYLAVKPSSSTCSTATWAGYANTGNSITGGVPFYDPATNQPYSTTTTYDGCTGVLACGSTVADPSALPRWELVRGDNTNTPTGSCTLVPFSFKLENQQVSFIVPDKFGQDVVVAYTVVLDPVDTDPYPNPNTTYDATKASAGWTAKRPELAWVSSDGTAAGAIWSPALACKSDTLADGLALLPTIPNTTPFKYLSDPPPAGLGYAAYTPGLQAKMCVSQLGWTSVNGQVQYVVKVIDQSDGFMNFPP